MNKKDEAEAKMPVKRTVLMSMISKEIRSEGHRTLGDWCEDQLIESGGRDVWAGTEAAKAEDDVGV